MFNAVEYCGAELVSQQQNYALLSAYQQLLSALNSFVFLIGR